MSFSSPAFTHSIPYKLFQQNGEAFCHWLNTASQHFDDPFFDDTIMRLKALPENIHTVTCTSQVSLLPDWAASIRAVQPTAFIFHLSRCGSTLVSQLLSLDEQHIVLPEVPFFDELLRAHLKMPFADTTLADDWLKAAVCFYGQQRTGTEKRLFIKTDCWHIFFYERLRKIYPNVPIILLYRSPEEVLRSQQKRRGMQAVPGIVEPEVLGIKQEDINYADFDHYFSMVMEKILGKFSHVAELDPLALLVNYNEGIVPVVKKLAAHCGMQLEDELLAKMNDRSRYHAKYPEQSFAGDELPDKMPGYLDTCMQWYQQLEKQRLSQRSQDKAV